MTTATKPNPKDINFFDLTLGDDQKKVVFEQRILQMAEPLAPTPCSRVLAWCGEPLSQYNDYGFVENELMGYVCEADPKGVCYAFEIVYVDIAVNGIGGWMMLLNPKPLSPDEDIY